MALLTEAGLQLSSIPCQGLLYSCVLFYFCLEFAKKPLTVKLILHFTTLAGLILWQEIGVLGSRAGIMQNSLCEPCNDAEKLC